MKSDSSIFGLSVIYFDDRNRNIYTKISTDIKQAKKLSMHIYKDAMLALYNLQVIKRPL